MEAPRPLLYAVLFLYFAVVRFSPLSFVLSMVPCVVADMLWSAHKRRQAVRAVRARAAQPDVRSTADGRRPRHRTSAQTSAPVLDPEALDGLRALGFSRSVATALLLASASSDLTTTEDRVVSALRANAVPSPHAV